MEPLAVFDDHERNCRWAGGRQMLLEPAAIAPDARLTALADHLTRIEQIEEDVARHKIRLEHLHEARLCRYTERDIRRLEQRRQRELDRIVMALDGQADLKRRFELVLGVRGIGQRTALAIVTACPNWAASAANGPPLSRVWRRLMTTAGGIKASVISHGSKPAPDAPAKAGGRGPWPAGQARGLKGSRRPQETPLGPALDAA